MPRKRKIDNIVIRALRECEECFEEAGIPKSDKIRRLVRTALSELGEKVK